MAVFASDVKIDPTLRANLGGNFSPGSRAQTDITDIYGLAKNRLASDAKARGVRPGSSYADSRLGASLGLSQQGLSTGLEGVLGNTAYQNYGNERSYNENTKLAQQIGALNKPNALEEVLGALGLAGKVGGAVYGAYQPQGKSYGALPYGMV